MSDRGTRIPRPERVKFEATHEPQDFLRWLNAYTNERRGGDDELHALCSWAHSVIGQQEALVRAWALERATTPDPDLVDSDFKADDGFGI